MRDPLPGISLQINKIPIEASTTIAAAGANVLVLTSALPARALTLTSTYLADSNGAVAVTRLAADAHAERFIGRRIAASRHHVTLAGACLLDHAAALRELLAERTDSLVTVDVDPAALAHAASVWGPSPPDS
jgi:hypothetical protein